MRTLSPTSNDLSGRAGPLSNAADWRLAGRVVGVFERGGMALKGMEAAAEEEDATEGGRPTTDLRPDCGWCE